MTDADTDLERLASLVGDPIHFAAEHWGRRPLHRPSGLDFSSVLDVNAIEQLLLTVARRPTFRLVRDGVTLPPEHSTRAVQLGGARLDDVADLERIAEAVDQGATLVLQGLQRTWPAVTELCRSLERATSHPVQANAYLTPPGAAGLRRHHDDHDVLVLQISGRKVWEVEGIGAITTVAGDVVYLPAGTAHAAEAQGEPSLHLTVGILRVTLGDAVRRALGALEAVDLDRALPLGYGRPEGRRALVDQLGNVVAALAQALAEFDVEAMATIEQERAGTRRRPHMAGQLHSILHLEALSPTSRASRRLDQPARLHDVARDDGRIVLELGGDRRLVLPAAMRPALAWVLEHHEVVAGDLPSLDWSGQRVLVRRLVREGLLTLHPKADSARPGGWRSWGLDSS